jgi:hypothetical protein
MENHLKPQLLNILLLLEAAQVVHMLLAAVALEALELLLVLLLRLERQ